MLRVSVFQDSENEREEDSLKETLTVQNISGTRFRTSVPF